MLSASESGLLLVAALGSAASTSMAMPFLQNLDSRAPHWPEIQHPEPGYVVSAASPGDLNATLVVTYSDGERIDPSTISVGLANETASWTIAENVTFYNSYWANATVVIPFADYADGNYTLFVHEMYDGSIVAEVTQPIALAQNTTSAVSTPTGTMEYNPTPTIAIGNATVIANGSDSAAPTLAPTAAPSSSGNETIADALTSFMHNLSQGWFAP